MRITGGQHRAQTVSRDRRAVAAAALSAALSAALLVGGSPAMANPGEGGEQGGGDQGQWTDTGTTNGTTNGTNSGSDQGTTGTDQGWTDPATDPADTSGDGTGQGGNDLQDGPMTGPTPNTGIATNGGGYGSAGFAPVWADPAIVPEPPVNENLPAEIDERAPFAQQISCDPVDRPGVTAFALLVADHYNRPTFYGSRPCIDYASFHHDGRALDWPLMAWDTNDRMIGDAVVAWLTADEGEAAKRFGIEYLIWNGLIWYADGRGFQYYSGDPHADHIHFSFTWDGAQMRTSWWTGVAVAEPDLGPCDVTPWAYAAVHQFPRLVACDASLLAQSPNSELGRVRPGESGPGVAMLQGVMGLEQTGLLDDKTRAALIEWQLDHHVPGTGVADAFTYAAAQGWDLGVIPESALAVLGEEWQRTEFTALKRTTLTEGDAKDTVKVLQRALDVEDDGDFGPKTAEALREFEESVPELALQAARRGDGPATVTPLTWIYLERAAHPTIPVRETELAIGDLDEAADVDGSRAAAAPVSADGEPFRYAGGAVTLLQRLLGVEADGDFGPMTQQAVMAVQSAAELEPNGVVDGPTWVAIEAEAIEEGRVDGLVLAAASDEGDDEDDGAGEGAGEDAEPGDEDWVPVDLRN
ncbi:peptidoglycan-binding domain-containing protein [Ornithinimicrobium sp. Y1694]|uniref:peptidoglycan-binding domain-containing protein n=1 Tax=Ornithinimicrobium sp. Y1694 TaxID=3418590 RepID=UPI003CEC210D